MRVVITSIEKKRKILRHMKKYVENKWFLRVLEDIQSNCDVIVSNCDVIAFMSNVIVNVKDQVIF